MSTTPAERAFAFFARGEVRDDIMSNWRIGLALQIDPETGVVFTQDKIAQATQQGSRWWIEADSIDLVGMAIQSRAMFLADQIRMDRAGHNFLVNFHGNLWGKAPLSASPGSGTLTTNATPGATYLGSVTIPDPAATTFRDQAGLQYQVLTTVVTPGSGVATLTLVGIDTGPATNLAPGTVLTIDLNPPIGAQPQGTVATQFIGGLADETDAAFQGRMRADIRHKPGSGNNAQFRSWARESTNAILDGYIYACAMHAGSVLVCITQKRTVALQGPNALQASAATLAQARAYLVPPASPVVPSRPFVVAVTFVANADDTIMQLSQVKASAAGWTDLSPWPGLTAAAAAITVVTNQTHFRMHSDIALPGGAGSLAAPNAPSLMVWNDAISRFEKLLVSSITDAGGGLFDVVLTQAPSKTLLVGDWISPDMARRDTLALSLEQYFDGLGPGEVVNLATDTRADRAARFPDPGEEAPSRGGQAIVTAVSDALGATVSNGSLFSMSVTTPALPADVVTGPGKLTLGKYAVYDLP